MASKGYEFSFCGGNHAKIDMIKIDMSICISRMTTKFGEEVHLEELTQTNQANAGDVTATLHYQITYGFQTWQDGTLR